MRPAPLEVVYLLGNSFSGSTVLGFLMAGSPDVLCLGELKMHNRIRRHLCSCGAAVSDCPFWSRLDARGHHLYSGSLWTKLGLSGQLLFARPVGGQPRPHDDLIFLEEVSVASGAPRFLLDASKSVWRLAHLARTPGINLSVIHVRRRMHGTVASSVKRYDRFWRPLAGCLLNNLLCERFLALHPEVRRLEVHHEDLCDDPDDVMARIGAFLGVDYTSYLHNLDKLELHVRSGNGDAIAEWQRSGLKLRSSREEEERWMDVFGPLQTRLLDLLAVRSGRAAGRHPG
jgi:hypothetical protein